ncbi:hypothetical protein A4X13_0g5570 [Tilletia indica]|uniref:Uncharacterized protein n=1 Tax=Tilletia indica TaxID=43049 RepID=A0A177TRR5_9BASI|nr:hypothetical protein A4X13_0g5570 [Tilletia indica]
MSSLSDMEQLEYVLHGSDDGGSDEYDWSDDGDGDDDGFLDEEDSEGDEDDQDEDNYGLADDNGVGDDSNSVTSDPDVPAKVPFDDLPNEAISALRTPQPIKQLFRDLGAMSKTSTESLREAVSDAHDILEMATKGKFLKKGKEIYVKRALIFFKHFAEMERKTARRDVPGTAASMLLRAVAHQLDVFHGYVLAHGYHSLVQRSAQRESIRTYFFSLFKSLRRATSHTEKHLALGKIGKLHQVAMKPRSRNKPYLVTLRPIVADLEETLGVASLQASETEEDGITGFPDLQTHMHLEFFFRSLRSPQGVQSSLKRKYDEQDAGPSQAEPAPSTESTTADIPSSEQAPGFQVLEELTASHLAFQDIEQLRSWKRRAASNFELMHRLWTTNGNRIRLSFTSLVPVLAGLTTVLYQTHIFDGADHVCELLVATVREAFEDSPSDANRIRLCSALGAYAVIAVEADRDEEGFRAAEDAISHLKTLCKNDSSKHLLLMAALKLSYSNALSRAADPDKGLEPDTQLCLLRKGVRVAEQAIGLARPTLKRNPSDPDASIILAFALSVKAELSTHLSVACEDVRSRHAMMRSQSGSSSRKPPNADDGIDTPYVFEKLADQTFGNLDDAGTGLEECIRIYRELAKENPHLYDHLLAEAIQTAAELYNSHIKPKPELCVPKFKEAISMLERLSETFTGHFDGLLEEANFDLALRLRGENRLEEAHRAFEEMVSKRPAGDDGASVPLWRGGNVLGGVFQARALMCARTEHYQQALVHAERSIHILRLRDPRSGRLTEPLAVKGFCKWVMNEDGKGAEAALRELKQSVKDAATYGMDYSKARHFQVIELSAYGFCLALGWMGGVQCALGQRNDARVNGEKAVRVMRSLLKSDSAVADAEQVSEPLEYVLPHLLVLLAGTHLEAGRYDEAKKAVEESLQVREKGVESSEGEKSRRMRADGPTRKTALLLRAMMLERDGLELEAKANRDEAEKIPFKGFLEILGCSSVKQLASETTKT